MRYISIPVLLALFGSFAIGQPAAKQPPTKAPPAKELIAKFRKSIGAGAKLSTPYVIKYRGERFLYSVADGKLNGEAYDFDSMLMGHSDTPNKHRKEMEMKIGIVPFKIVEVVDGDTGWYQINDGEAIVMSKNLIQGRRQREIHVEVFLGQETFSPEQWKFSEPKSASVGGRECWELEATTTGREPITLSFSKQSGLLMRLKTKATDFALLPGAEAKVESFTRDLRFYDWKKVGNAMLPGHLDAFHDGILWQKLEPVSVTFPKTIDEKLFVMPQVKK